MESLRVAWLNQLDPLHPWAGGAERHIYEVSKRLVQNGHDVTIISERFRGSPVEDTIGSVKVIRPGNRFGIHLWAAAYFNEAGQFDIAVQDLSKILPWDLLGSWAVPSIAIVRHLNESALLGEIPLAAPVLWATERSYGLLLRRTPVVTEARCTAERLVNFGVPGSSITLVRPGVDHSVFTPDPSFRSPTPLIVYAGRLKRYKRVDLAMRAFAIVRKSVSNARMIVVGDGVDAPRLHLLRERLGLSSEIDFLGKVSPAELVNCYRRAWVHVQPSSAEGWGYTVMEAAACGTPTVAFAGTALEESVGPDCQRYLARSTTPVAFANAIACCLEDMSARPGDIARQVWEYAEEFDWERSTGAFGALLRHALDKPRNMRVEGTELAALGARHLQPVDGQQGPISRI